VINARFGTPVRVNIFSGLVATAIVILAETITSGNAAKYFGAVLGVTISTTLISYLGIYPAVWKLRRSHPEVERPFRMPWMKPLTVVLVLLVLVATIQLVAPGLGDTWFGSNYAPDGWDPSQKWVYLLTEALPVVVFALIGVLFWWLGRGTRAEVVQLEPVAVEAAD
jgi:amino acid transporter